MIYKETEERPEILDRVEAAGFATFDGAFDLNLIGLRNPEAKANKFDDQFHVICKDEKTFGNTLFLSVQLIPVCIGSKTNKS